MNCTNPIDPAILADYRLAALALPEEETVEEHLFQCDESSRWRKESASSRARVPCSWS